MISLEIKHIIRIKTTKCNQTTKNPGKNEQLAFWLNALKTEKMQGPWVKGPLGIKTPGCSRPGGKSINRLKIRTQDQPASLEEVRTYPPPTQHPLQPLHPLQRHPQHQHLVLLQLQLTAMLLWDHLVTNQQQWAQPSHEDKEACLHDKLIIF